jgi:NAD(P)-dependent dehydrogenase (short-subunit alcohol dehydrogenase family)
MRTAIITGGTKGIGYGIAESLIKEGWHVAITGRTKNTLDEAVNRLLQIRKEYAIGIVADVRSFEQQQSVVDEVLKTWGQLDALIANAGIGYFGSIETL